MADIVWDLMRLSGKERVQKAKEYCGKDQGKLKLLLACTEAADQIWHIDVNANWKKREIIQKLAYHFESVLKIEPKYICRIIVSALHEFVPEGYVREVLPDEYKDPRTRNNAKKRKKLKDLAQASVLNNNGGSSTVLIEKDGWILEGTTPQMEIEREREKHYNQSKNDNLHVNYLPAILRINKKDKDRLIGSLNACNYECYLEFDWNGYFVSVETDVEREQRIEKLFDSDLSEFVKKRQE